jgi:hypothetical protein
MIKSILILILIILLFSTSGYPDYRSKEQIAPGVVYFHDYLSSGPWHLHILEVDLSNPQVELESVKAKKVMFARENPLISVSLHLIRLLRIISSPLIK